MPSGLFSQRGATCVCPCHDGSGHIEVRHIVACCCPHRFIVDLDCDECTNADRRMHEGA